MIIYTHRTAIKRKTGSRPVRDLIEGKYLLNVKSILDFGCGHGGDAKYLRECHGGIVNKHDPHPSFGTPRPTYSEYDMVTMIYVVNVIPREGDRRIALRNAWRMVAPGGLLFLASRTEREVEDQAAKYGWETYGDGYVTSRKTFQKGYNAVQLLLLAKIAPGVRSSLCEWHVTESKKYTGLLLAKRRWT